MGAKIEKNRELANLEHKKEALNLQKRRLSAYKRGEFNFYLEVHVVKGVSKVLWLMAFCWVVEFIVRTLRTGMTLATLRTRTALTTLRTRTTLATLRTLATLTAGRTLLVTLGLLYQHAV